MLHCCCLLQGTIDLCHNAILTCQAMLNSVKLILEAGISLFLQALHGLVQLLLGQLHHSVGFLILQQLESVNALL